VQATCHTQKTRPSLGKLFSGQVHGEKQEAQTSPGVEGAEMTLAN